MGQLTNKIHCDGWQYRYFWLVILVLSPTKYNSPVVLSSTNNLNFWRFLFNKYVCNNNTVHLYLTKNMSRDHPERWLNLNVIEAKDIFEKAGYLGVFNTTYTSIPDHAVLTWSFIHNRNWGLQFRWLVSFIC